MAHYKRSNGLIQMRGSGGKFRKSTLEDFGIYDANKNLAVYICNVCEREFVPVLHSGKCCGVDNKRLKEVVLTDKQKEIQTKINAIRSKHFINRVDLDEITKLEKDFKKP